MDISGGISDRGGVLGAMDTMYQRGKIQEESLYYSVFHKGRKKHDGSLPLIGVNTFLPRDHAGETATTIELIRSTEEEKGQQITNVQAFQKARNKFAPSGETGHAHESIPPTLPSSKSTTATACATCRTPHANAATCSKH